MSRLIVKNLPSNFEEKALKKKFAEFGKLTDCKLMKTDKGKSRRFGFIGFQSEKNAEKALEKLNNSLFLNQKVCVEICKNFTAELKKKEKKVKVDDKKTTNKNGGDKNVEYNKDGYWVKMRGCPYSVTESQIKDFFFPLQVKQIEILKNNNGNKSGFVLAEFQNEKDQKQAMKSNKDYLQGRYIELQVYQQNFKKSLATKLNKKKKDVKFEEIDEDISETGRLYVRNLAFSCTEEDLLKLFEKYGPVSENIIVCDNQTGESLGFGFITYMMPEHAIEAFNSLDGSIFQGRMLHVLPAKPKTSDEKPEYKHHYTNTSSFKQQKEAELKKNAESSHNWNTLFIGGNAVADAIVEKYGADKMEVLDSTKSHSAAVRLALGETELVQETKKFLADNNISLESFNHPDSKRSKNVIIAKNLAASTTSGELRNKFDKYGKLKRVLLAPAGTTAVIEFVKLSEAKTAFMKEAYRNFHHKPLYLEWAPLDIFKTAENEKDNDKKGDEKETKPEGPSSSAETMTLFVKNLNFDTKQEDMKKHFEQIGPVINCIISQKKNLRSNTMLSMGYGFVEYQHKKDGLECLKKLQGSELDDHNLELKKSEKQLVQKPTGRKQAKNQENVDDINKIVVRNIPFQANKHEIRDLFEAFGELKTVRLPTKLNPNLNEAGSQHRGFGFVDFVTRENAKTAFEALCQSTHLYGRRLVLEWAQTESSNEESLKRKNTEHYNTLSKKSKSILKVDHFEESLNNLADNDDSD